MKNEIVSAAIAKFGFTARPTGDLVSVYNAKGRLAGTVDASGNIDRKFEGKQALMGALVRDAISTALKGEN